MNYSLQQILRSIEGSKCGWLSKEKIMIFKDLTTRAAAILKAKPAEASKKEPQIKARDAAAKPGSPSPKKT